MPRHHDAWKSHCLLPVHLEISYWRYEEKAYWRIINVKMKIPSKLWKFLLRPEIFNPTHQSWSGLLRMKSLAQMGNFRSRMIGFLPSAAANRSQNRIAVIVLCYHKRKRYIYPLIFYRKSQKIQIYTYRYAGTHIQKNFTVQVRSIQIRCTASTSSSRHWKQWVTEHHSKTHMLLLPWIDLKTSDNYFSFLKHVLAGGDIPE